MSDQIHGYSKIWNLGHPEVKELFDREVRVEEKVDGSQFSFKRDAADGDVHFRSKNAPLFLEVAGMFSAGVSYILSRKELLIPGVTYRAEYLSKPKHNAIKYERVPKNHIVLYDMEATPYDFVSRTELEAEADLLGVDVIPELARGTIFGPASLTELLNRESFLGGEKIEGVVVKPLVPYFGRDSKAIMGKYVREDFKERNSKGWKDANPHSKDILQKIVDALKTDQAWEKAVQHLRDANELESSPRDIGKIIREVQKDVFEENEAEIKDLLMKWARKNISSKITAGLPEWYKKKLMESQFDNQLSGMQRADGDGQVQSDVLEVQKDCGELLG